MLKADELNRKVLIYKAAAKLGCSLTGKVVSGRLYIKSRLVLCILKVKTMSLVCP